MTNSFGAIFQNFIKDSVGNPYGLLLSIIILFFIISLFAAIFSKSIKRNLIAWNILEKEESPAKLLTLIIVILIIVKIIQGFIIQPFLVDGGSMLPTMQSGELLIIDKLSFDVNQLKTGDVIVFRHVKDDEYNGQFFIKRLIGVPGDRVIVKSGVTTIYNEANPTGEILDESFVKYPDYGKDLDITLGANEYVAFGDNRAESYDSRSWGIIYKKDIAGKAVFRLFPFAKIGSEPGAVAIDFTKN
jgi:signal peptidase I